MADITMADLIKQLENSNAASLIDGMDNKNLLHVIELFNIHREVCDSGTDFDVYVDVDGDILRSFTAFAAHEMADNSDEYTREMLSQMSLVVGMSVGAEWLRRKHA